MAVTVLASDETAALVGEETAALAGDVAPACAPALASGETAAPAGEATAPTLQFAGEETTLAAPTDDEEVALAEWQY